jgi:hypothetical protein
MSTALQCCCAGQIHTLLAGAKLRRMLAELMLKDNTMKK